MSESLTAEQIDEKPDWWPQNPWPESIFPMTLEEYVKAIPDEKLRTAISGHIARWAWEVCEREVIWRMNEAIREAEGEATRAERERTDDMAAMLKYVREILISEFSFDHTDPKGLKVYQHEVDEIERILREREG